MRLTTKEALLWLVSSIIVTITRHLLQYDYFPWHKGLFIFLVSWFLNLVGIGVISALVTVSASYFIRQEKQSDDALLKTSLIFTCLTLAVVSLIILFFKYVWAPGVPMGVGGD